MAKRKKKKIIAPSTFSPGQRWGLLASAGLVSLALVAGSYIIPKATCLDMQNPLNNVLAQEKQLAEERKRRAQEVIVEEQIEYKDVTIPNQEPRKNLESSVEDKYPPLKQPSLQEQKKKPSDLEKEIDTNTGNSKPSLPENDSPIPSCPVKPAPSPLVKPQTTHEKPSNTSINQANPLQRTYRDIQNIAYEPVLNKEIYRVPKTKIERLFAGDIVVTTKSEFSIDSYVWNNLPRGLSKKQLYDIIKESPIQSKSTVILEAKAIESRELLENFERAADYFISFGPNSLDPAISFTSVDKQIFLNYVNRALIDAQNETGTNKFSNGSQLIFRSYQGKPSLEVKIANRSGLQSLPISFIQDPNEIQSIKKFMLYSMFYPDLDDPRNKNRIPIDGIYARYNAKN
ncbi:MAG: hypothetical protein Q8N99_06945 [Nanoarchaeota archaeon]|nr:hypothetical protein [Nanoarchaeota archaeon]